MTHACPRDGDRGAHARDQRRRDQLRDRWFRAAAAVTARGERTLAASRAPRACARGSVAGDRAPSLRTWSLRARPPALPAYRLTRRHPRAARNPPPGGGLLAPAPAARWGSSGLAPA